MLKLVKKMSGAIAIALGLTFAAGSVQAAGEKYSLSAMLRIRILGGTPSKTR